MKKFKSESELQQPSITEKSSGTPLTPKDDGDAFLSKAEIESMVGGTEVVKTWRGTKTTPVDPPTPVTKSVDFTECTFQFYNVSTSEAGITIGCGVWKGDKNNEFNPNNNIQKFAYRWNRSMTGLTPYGTGLPDDMGSLSVWEESPSNNEFFAVYAIWPNGGITREYIDVRLIIDGTNYYLSSDGADNTHSGYVWQFSSIDEFFSRLRTITGNNPPYKTNIKVTDIDLSILID